MKYIVVSISMGPNLVKEIPIIFPNDLVHANVFEAIKTMKHLGEAKIVSAGELSSLGITSECHGQSTSLKGVVSRETTDTKLIQNYDYFHGLVDD